MRGKTRKGLEEQRSGEKGSAALVAVLVVVVLLTLCGAMLSMALRSKDERGSSVDEHQALFAARSGVAHAMVQLADEDNPNRDQDIGSPDDLREFVGSGPILTDNQPLVEYFLSLPRDRDPDFSQLRKGDFSQLLAVD